MYEPVRDVGGGSGGGGGVQDFTAGFDFDFFRRPSPNDHGSRFDVVDNNHGAEKAGFENFVVDDVGHKGKGSGKKGGYGDLKDKPHLFTADPYAEHPPANGYKPPSYGYGYDHAAPEPHAPEPHGYQPEPHGYQPEPHGYQPEPHGYQPEPHGYQPEPHRYHEPEPYHPDPHPHSGYHEEPHSDYHPAPYKPEPKPPVLLDKRPHEVKEIKALPVSLHDTYTSFDCRKAPYPDRHYADPEAGCQVTRNQALKKKQSVT